MNKTLAILTVLTSMGFTSKFGFSKRIWILF